MPNRLLLLDLFRDQLDRYGEVATVARLWSRALARLPESTGLVANVDDPLVTHVAESSTGEVAFFGIESAEGGAQTLDHAGDVKACPRCGGRIEYSRVFLGHLGHYRCVRCALHRLHPSVRAVEVRLLGMEGSEFRVVTAEREVAVHLPLPGLYNVYNALAAAATCLSLGIDPASIAASLRTVTAAFGRMERLSIQGRSVVLALAKNPAGMNEVLRTIVSSEEQAHLMMMLNDNTADGRDVSWIWDADIEMLRSKVKSAVFGGVRAEDMALRFKYARVLDDRQPPSWEIIRETAAAFHRALSLTPIGGRLFVVPTYTALLDIRNTLSRLGYVKPYWEE